MKGGRAGSLGTRTRGAKGTRRAINTAIQDGESGTIAALHNTFARSRIFRFLLGPQSENAVLRRSRETIGADESREAYLRKLGGQPSI